MQPLYQKYLIDYYDSTAVLSESYPLTWAWLELLSSHAANNTLNAGLGDWSAVEDKSLVTTATGVLLHASESRCPYIESTTFMSSSRFFFWMQGSTTPLQSI